jgi:hypothetical protein
MEEVTVTGHNTVIDPGFAYAFNTALLNAMTPTPSLWSRIWSVIQHGSPVAAGIMITATVLQPEGPGEGVDAAILAAEGAEAGTATVSEYATAQGVHYSIEVASGRESLATEQIITSAANDTSIAVNTSTGAVRTWTISLPQWASSTRLLS